LTRNTPKSAGLFDAINRCRLYHRPQSTCKSNEAPSSNDHPPSIASECRLTHIGHPTPTRRRRSGIPPSPIKGTDCDGLVLACTIGGAAETNGAPSIGGSANPPAGIRNPAPTRLKANTSLALRLQATDSGLGSLDLCASSRQHFSYVLHLPALHFSSHGSWLVHVGQ